MNKFDKKVSDYNDFHFTLVSACVVAERLSDDLNDVLDNISLDNYKSVSFTNTLKDISKDIFSLIRYRAYIEDELDSRETDDGE